jgi:hypothetical protein
LRIYAWKAFSDNFSDFYIYGNTEKNNQFEPLNIGSNLSPDEIDRYHIYESPYLQLISNYGLGALIIFAFMILYLTAINYIKYNIRGLSEAHKRKCTLNFMICCLIIFDSFYGIFFFCSITWLTIFPLIANERS